MIMRTDESVNARIAKLQKELGDLQQQVAGGKTLSVSRLPARGRPPKEKGAEIPAAETSKLSKTGKSKRRRHSRTRNRAARVEIAPGIALTANPGTLYATICAVLARLGNLAHHDVLFTAFTKDETASGAHKLLQHIGIARTELQERLYSDEFFNLHCQKRSERYKAAAAAGSKRHQRLLKDPHIFDSDGNWRGNLSEAIATLYGARTLGQVRRGKNLQILNKAGLMFDSLMIGTEQFCFLYKQKWHSEFKKALTLAKS